MIMPSGQRQQIGRGVGARNASPHLAEFVDGGFQADNRDDVHPLQLGLETGRNRHAAALDLGDLQLAGNRLLAEGFEGASDHLLVGDEDLGLVQGNAERLGVGDLGADQAHLLGQMLGRTTQRDDVALLQHQVGIGAQRLAATRHVDDAIFGIGLAEVGNALADLGRIFQPVGAQAELPIAGEAAAFEILDAEFLLVLLRRRLGVDAPPARQVFADQDDADGAPDVGDAVGQRDHARRVLGLHALRQLDDARGDRLLGRADRGRHGLRTRQHATGRADRQREELCANDDKRQTEHARHQRQDAEFETVALQAVDEGRPDAQADAVHEEVVEQALDEVVQLELHAVGRGPDRQAGAHHDGAGDHAEAIALDARPSDPDGEPDDEEQQQIRILLQECEKALHVRPPL